MRVCGFLGCGLSFPADPPSCSYYSPWNNLHREAFVVFADFVQLEIGKKQMLVGIYF